jgi:hypothetical protein
MHSELHGCNVVRGSVPISEAAYSSLPAAAASALDHTPARAEEGRQMTDVTASASEAGRGCS